jgi:hypothetical protein
MLLKRRPPGISSEAAQARQGFEHLDPDTVAVLRWLNANKVDFILVGPVARSIRGELGTAGPVAIVPAPYARNWERLCSALSAGRAGLRTEPASGDGATAPVAAPIKLTAEKLARGRRWFLRFGSHDLDIEASAVAPPVTNGQARAAEGAPDYQELLYEASRFEVAEGVSVEVAAPEDLEHYSHVRRTGTSPEFRVTRATPSEQKPA